MLKSEEKNKRKDKKIKIKKAKNDKKKAQEKKWLFGRSEYKKKPEEEKISEKVVYLPLQPEYKVIEEYWIEKPFSKVKIVVLPEMGGQRVYFIEEVQLTPNERKAVDKLIDILSIELNPPEGFEEDIRTHVINEARRLVKKYKRAIHGLSEESWEKVIYYIERDLLGYGPIDVMMRDYRLEDISCDGVNRAIHVWHRDYESIPTNVIFIDKEYLREFIIKLAHMAGKHISAAFPIVDAMLPGRHRLAATYGEEVSPRGSTFTIRKFREKPLSIISLLESGNIDEWTAAYFWLMLENRITAMIIGATAAGKTTLLNALTSFFKPGFKIVTIEETPELNLPHENWVQLVSRESYGLGEAKVGEITLFDLVKVSLRYRPDYIIVGEIRGEEAFVLFQAMSSVSWDTPILVREKDKIQLMPIGKIVDKYYAPSEERLPKAVKDIEVLTLDGYKATFKPVRYVLRHWADEIYRVKYLGGEIRATGSHSVYVLDEETLGIRAKPVSELKKGDLLVSFRKRVCREEYPEIDVVRILASSKNTIVDNIPNDLKTKLGINKNPLPISEFYHLAHKHVYHDTLRVRKRNSFKSIPAKLRLDEDLAFVFGLYLADGCVKYGRGGKIVFSLGKNEKEIYLNRLLRVIREKFNDSPYIEDRGSYLLIEYNNRILSELFARLCGKKRGEKKIPDHLWYAPYSVISAFIEGLSADARRKTKRPNQLQIIQKNKEIIVQLAWLARLGGYNVRLNIEKGGYWNLTIAKNGSKSPIGLGIPVATLKRIYSKLKSSSMPYQFTDVLTRKDRRQRFISINRATKIIEWMIEHRCEEPDKETGIILERLKSYFDGEVVVHPVKEVLREEYNGYVYDISIPGNEAFFGGVNPILLHNTGHGGMSTMHADSLDRAVKRLVSPPMNVSPAYIPSLNIVVLTERTILPSGQFSRRIRRVWEIEDYGRYREIVRWNPTNDRHEIINDSYLLPRLAEFQGKTVDELLKEINRRQVILRWLKLSGIKEMKDVSKVILEYYISPNKVYQQAVEKLKKLGIKIEEIRPKVVISIAKSPEIKTSSGVKSFISKGESKSAKIIVEQESVPEKVEEKNVVVKKAGGNPEDDILKILQSLGGEADYVSLINLVGLNKKDFSNIVRRLIRSKMIIPTIIYVENRPTLGYKLTKDGEKRARELSRST